MSIIGNFPIKQNLTSEDIKVSDSDQTTIATALSNKVTITGNNMAGLDCNNFISDGRYQCQGEVLNSPPWYPGTGYGHFFVDVYHHADSWIVQVAHAVDHIGSFVRHCIGGTWQEWEKIATTTPPQQFDLPLAEGWTSQISGSCRYAKSQENIVFVTFKVVHDEATPASTDTMIATLPEGFLPSALVHSVCIRSDFVSSSIAVFCTQDGGVWVHSQQEIPSGVGVAGEIIFVAVD